MIIPFTHFNTLYVSVQDQILFFYLALNAISIHYMFQFKSLFIDVNNNISYFNTLYVSVQEILLYLVDTRLKNFNTLYVSVQVTSDNSALFSVALFQYIICFSSSLKVLIMYRFLINFNTLYVSVQEKKRTFYSNRIKISIHYMFQFK